MQYLLFTTSQCPKCPAFKTFVTDNVKFDGMTLNEQSPNFMSQVQKYGVQKAPTFIVFEDETEIFRTDEISELADFLKAN